MGMHAFAHVTDRQGRWAGGTAEEEGGGRVGWGGAGWWKICSTCYACCLPALITPPYLSITTTIPETSVVDGGGGREGGGGSGEGGTGNLLPLFLWRNSSLPSPYLLYMYLFCLFYLPIHFPLSSSPLPPLTIQGRGRGRRTTFLRSFYFTQKKSTSSLDMLSHTDTILTALTLTHSPAST